jgi:transposase
MNQRYTQEFKDSTIQLILNSDKSVLQIARELDVSDKTLYSWMRAYREKNNIPSASEQSKESLEQENRRLRQELAQVKKEREILKKAAAYFAKEAH